eukprot:Pgem_evm2s16540
MKFTCAAILSFALLNSVSGGEISVEIDFKTKTGHYSSVLLEGDDARLYDFSNESYNCNNGYISLTSTPNLSRLEPNTPFRKATL